jgi:hypothetical protein
MPLIKPTPKRIPELHTTVSVAELIAIKVADFFAMAQIGAHSSVPLGTNVRAKEPYPLVRAPQAVPDHLHYLGRHEVSCF